MSARPRVVLVHGWSVDSRVWDHLAGRLGEDHDVLVADLPGHHGAPLGWTPGEGRSFHDHAVGSLAAWWREVDAGDAPVVAWAWGGQVVVDAVARGLVEPASVALLSGAAPFQSERIREEARRDWPALASRLVAAMGAEPLPAEVQTRLVELMTSTDVVAVDAVHAVRWKPPEPFELPPASIAILGAADRLTPPGPNAELAGRWGAEVHLLDGVGHVPFVEDEAVVLDLLTDWLGRARRPGGR